mgnify:CR=1 FL=1
MPVVELSLSRLQNLVGKKANKKQILDSLPFLGLDIESLDGNIVRVEYSPNRPDYSTDFGIALGLQGILGISKGMLKLDVKKQGNYEKALDNLLKAKSIYQEINTIKNLDSHACIGVDVIVGYPSETEEEFIETYEFLKNQDVSYLHVFTYSERENTRAIDLKPAVPFKERSNRSKLLRELSDQKKAQFYKKSIGASRPLLVENNKNGILFGYTDNYIKVKINAESCIENTIQMVNILDFRAEYMLGKIEAAG